MDNYEVLGPIGQGSFAKVFKILRRSDQKIFVWKEMLFAKMSDKEKQQLVSEVNILRELKHPNIVKYYDRIIDKQNQKIYIIMEYCEGGDLAQFLKKIKKEKEEFPEDAIWKILSQIIMALYEIHKRKEGKILHRDIKPANIFLDAQQNVKLGDFGLAKMLGEESEYAHTSVGTPYYMSPELINENKYNEKSDIWACGCLIYEICSLLPPFTAQNYLTLAVKIKKAQFSRIPIQYSDEMQRVISWCLQIDQRERPSVDDLLNLPQVSLRLREKRLKENSLVLAKREEAIFKKELALKEMEIKLRMRERELSNIMGKFNSDNKDIPRFIGRVTGENKENITPNDVWSSIPREGNFRFNQESAIKNEFMFQ